MTIDDNANAEQQTAMDASGGSAASMPQQGLVTGGLCVLEGRRVAGSNPFVLAERRRMVSIDGGPLFGFYLR